MHHPGAEKEAIFYHALNIAENSGYRALQKQYAKHGSWEKCWHCKSAGKAVNPAREWAALLDSGINLALAGDPSYPPLLAETPFAPFGIYFKGLLAAASMPSIAIVGTRKASTAGAEIAKSFSSALAGAGSLIISGLAFGIDAAAHFGALEAGGRTIAVLANGLDDVYPASHEQLAKHIIEGGGALISEYPPGSPPLAHRFLERNRIISGLAAAVLAVEAPERSGVLATARFAADQNRDLFVVPGPISHPNYRGSHALIRTGATLVTSPFELLADLGFEVPAAFQPADAETPQEESVLQALFSAGRPLAIDEIIEAATLTSSMANRALTMLILKNAVQEEDGLYSLR